MIVSMDEDSMYTEGCGCCSNSIAMKDKDKILLEALENLEIVYDICKIHDIDYLVLCKVIKMRKEEKSWSWR